MLADHQRVLHSSTQQQAVAMLVQRLKKELWTLKPEREGLILQLAPDQEERKTPHSSQ